MRLQGVGKGIIVCGGVLQIFMFGVLLGGSQGLPAPLVGFFFGVLAPVLMFVTGVVLWIAGRDLDAELAKFAADLKALKATNRKEYQDKGV